MRRVLLSIALAGALASPAGAAPPLSAESQAAVAALNACFPRIAGPSRSRITENVTVGPVTLIMRVEGEKVSCIFSVNTANFPEVHAALTAALLKRPERFAAGAVKGATGTHVTVDFYCAGAGREQYWAGVGETLPGDAETLALFLVTQQPSRDPRCDNPNA